MKTRNGSHIYRNVAYDNKLISNISTLKFLGLLIDDKLTCKNHIEMIMPKLSAACFVIRVVKPCMTHDTLKMIYSSYFHSIMSYGLTFWGNSSCSSSIFKIQERIIRIVMNAGTRDSCKELFKILKILPLQSKYILSLMLFWVTVRINFR